MDTLYISVCFIALFASSFGEEPLQVTFENTTRVDVVEGSQSIQFRCHLNRPALFVLNNKLEMIHVDPITSKETVLSSAANLVEGEPTFYDADMESHPEKEGAMVLVFNIRTVRFQDDGIFRCQLHLEDESTKEFFAEREVLVHRPISSLKLKFGDFDPLEDSPADPMKIDHGDYKVSCIAEGSNPATEDLHLSFHGLMLDHTEPVVTALEEGPGRKYKSEINGSVKILVSNSGQELVCQAQDSTGQSKSIKLSISVNIYDPVVSCNDSEAHLGQDNPILYCTVNYTGFEVDGFSYQIGDTGEIVKEGENHPKNIVVTVSNVAPGISVVSLDLHKAEQQYLDKNYYILIDMKGGHTSKESVRLSEKEAPPSENGNTSNGNGDNGMIGDEGHGVRLVPVALLYVVMCVVAFWSSH